MKKSSLSDKLNRLNQELPVSSKAPEKNKRAAVPETPKVAERAARSSQKEKPEITVHEEVSDEDHEDELISKALKEEKDRRRKQKAGMVIQTFLILACIYSAFLIYGAAVTTFEYDSSGKAAAQRMKTADITEKKAYEKIYYYYEACRGLYESTLLLDYRLGAGEEDPLTIAPEYEALLDTVENLSIKTDALTVDTGYSQLKSMMLSWIQNDIAVYLQNMSSAISTNDTDTANNALQDKDRVYDDFLLITQNMAAFGENIKGVDLDSIRQWTPENYIDKEINGETS